MKLIIAE